MDPNADRVPDGKFAAFHSAVVYKKRLTTTMTLLGLILECGYRALILTKACLHLISGGAIISTQIPFKSGVDSKMIMPTQKSAVFHRSLAKEYTTASAGTGVYIIHSDGSRTLDGCSGAAVSCLGHGHPAVIDAIVEQTKKLAYAHTAFFTTDPAEELASLLIQQSEGIFTKVMLVSSGSEAVESAIKITRQYHIARGEPQRVNYICRKFSYHGNTLGALAAGYNMARRIPFEPILSQAFHHVSRCFFSKDASEGEDEEAYVDRLIVEYEEMFQKLGPSSVAAVMIEPVSGATLGAVPAARGYLARLRELCDKHGALLIYDEVMCGMGRLGTTHAWQSLGSVAPDLQTIGKGLSGGYQPVSAILVGPKVHQVMQATTISHPFVSGHTYQGHTIGCAAALATQQVMVNENLLTNVKAMGVLLERELRERTPMLKETRGLGLFVGVEFATQPDGPIAAHVVQTCLTKGAAIYLASPASDTVIFAPPFIINEREVKELVQIFVEATKQVLEGNDES